MTIHVTLSQHSERFERWLKWQKYSYAVIELTHSDSGYRYEIIGRDVPQRTMSSPVSEARHVADNAIAIAIDERQSVTIEVRP